MASYEDHVYVAGSADDSIAWFTRNTTTGALTYGGKVTDGIVHRQGPYAPYLAVIESIERSDPMAIRRHLDALGIPIFDCNQALMRALAATQKLDAEQDNRSEEMIFAPV